MKVSLCTISFRHHLLSIGEIARFARGSGFDGLELWGVHAGNLGPGDHGEWLAEIGLCVPMLSDYLPLAGPRPALVERLGSLARLARLWHAPRLRTFAGMKGSAEMTPDERKLIAERLKLSASFLADQGLRLLIETHPATLADNLGSLTRLIDEVDHPNLKVNFDAIHVWEGGDDPLDALDRLAGQIDYHHLKNIRDRADLCVFEPANVYAAAGSREGMTSLFAGALDYRPILNRLAPDAEVSLEWFGNSCFTLLPSDLLKLRAATAKQVNHATFQLDVAS